MWRMERTGKMRMGRTVGGMRVSKKLVVLVVCTISLMIMCLTDLVRAEETSNDNSDANTKLLAEEFFEKRDYGLLSILNGVRKQVGVNIQNRANYQRETKYQRNEEPTSSNRWGQVEAPEIAKIEENQTSSSKLVEIHATDIVPLGKNETDTIILTQKMLVESVSTDENMAQVVYKFNSDKSNWDQILSINCLDMNSCSPHTAMSQIPVTEDNTVIGSHALITLVGSGFQPQTSENAWSSDGFNIYFAEISDDNSFTVSEPTNFPGSVKDVLGVDLNYPLLVWVTAQSYSMMNFETGWDRTWQEGDKTYTQICAGENQIIGVLGSDGITIRQGEISEEYHAPPEGCGAFASIGCSDAYVLGLTQCGNDVNLITYEFDNNNPFSIETILTFPTEENMTVFKSGSIVSSSLGNTINVILTDAAETKSQSVTIEHRSEADQETISSNIDSPETLIAASDSSLFTYESNGLSSFFSCKRGYYGYPSCGMIIPSFSDDAKRCNPERGRRGYYCQQCQPRWGGENCDQCVAPWGGLYCGVNIVGVIIILILFIVVGAGAITGYVLNRNPEKKNA